MQPTAQSGRAASLRPLVLIRRAMFRQFAVAALRSLGEDDITFTQLVTLFLLRSEETETISSIAETLNRSVSATSRLVDGLVRLGFVERDTDPDDRRAKRLRVAEKGRRFFERIEEGRADVIGRALSKLTPEERASVLRAHALVARALEARSI